MRPITNLIVIVLFLLIASSCSNKDESPVADKDDTSNYFKAVTVNGGKPFTLIDKSTNRAYIFEAVTLGGRMHVFNYSSKELEYSVEKPLDFFGEIFAIGLYNSTREIYTFINKSIRIYSAEDLHLIDEIQVFDDASENTVRTPVHIEPNLFFLPTDTDNRQIISVDRNDGKLISQSSYGKNALRLKGFVSSENGDISIVGINNFTNQLSTISCKFDSNGLFIENSIRSQGVHGTIHVRHFSPIYIVGTSILSTDESSLIGSLLFGNLKDLIIGDMFLLVIEDNNYIRKYSKDGTNLGVIDQFDPMELSFFDQGMLTLVHYIPHDNGGIDIYFSIVVEEEL